MSDLCFKWINHYNEPDKRKAVQEKMLETEIGRNLNAFLERTLQKRLEISQAEPSEKDWDAKDIQSILAQLKEVSGKRSAQHGINLQHFQQTYRALGIQNNKRELIFSGFGWFNTHCESRVRSQAGAFLVHALSNNKQVRLQSLVYPFILRHIAENKLNEGYDWAKRFEKIENPNSLLGIALLYQMMRKPVEAYALTCKMMNLPQNLHLPSYHRAKAAEIAGQYCLHMATTPGDTLRPRQRVLQAIQKFREAIELGEKSVYKQLADAYSKLAESQEKREIVDKFSQLSKEALDTFDQLLEDEKHILAPNFCYGLCDCPCEYKDEYVASQYMQSIRIGDQNLIEPVYPENETVERKLTDLDRKGEYATALQVLETLPVKNSWRYVNWKFKLLNLIVENKNVERKEYENFLNMYIEMLENLFSRGFVCFAFDIVRTSALKLHLLQNATGQADQPLQLNDEIAKLISSIANYMDCAKESGDPRVDKLKKIQQKQNTLQTNCEKTNYSPLQITFTLNSDDPAIGKIKKLQTKLQKQQNTTQQSCEKPEFHPVKMAPDDMHPGEQRSRKLEQKLRDEAIQKEIDEQKKKDEHVQKTFQEASEKFIPSINYTPFSSEMAPIKFSQTTEVSAEVYNRLSDLYAHKPVKWKDFGRLIQDLGGRCGRQHNGTWQYSLPHRQDSERLINRTMHNPVHNTGEEINFTSPMQRDCSINLLLFAGYMLEALTPKS